MSAFSGDDVARLLADLRELVREAERQTALLERILERLASIEATQVS